MSVCINTYHYHSSGVTQKEKKDIFTPEKEVHVAIITVSPDILREKARLIRKLLDENKAAHQQLWLQVSTQVNALPRDLAASHAYANTPWNQAIEEHYANYYQLALSMEAAADAYERGDKDVQISFTPAN